MPETWLRGGDQRRAKREKQARADALDKFGVRLQAEDVRQLAVECDWRATTAARPASARARARPCATTACRWATPRPTPASWSKAPRLQASPLVKSGRKSRPSESLR